MFSWFVAVIDDMTQMERMSGYGLKSTKSVPSSYFHLPSNAPQTSGFVGEMYGACDFLRSISRPSEADKPIIVELAVSGMEELSRMAQAGEPLWVPADTKSSEVVLNEAEYLSCFGGRVGPKPLGFRTEASRVSAIVFMNHIKLVDILMDAVRLCLILILNLFSILINVKLIICLFVS